MCKKTAIILSIFSILISGCASNNTPDMSKGVSWETTPELKLTPSEEIGLKDFSGFGIKFLSTFAASEIAKESPNFSVSPISLTEAVGILANASDNDANCQAIYHTLGFESLAELNAFNEKVMRYLPHNREGITVSLANSFWYDKNLKPSSKLALNLDKYFMSAFSPADFTSTKTAEIINNWAAKNTNNLITKIVTPDDYLSTPFLLANATYFNGEWDHHFSEDKKISDFKTYSGKIVKLKLMDPGTANGYVVTDGEISIARIHYKGRKTFMDIITPESDGDIYKIMASLTPEKYFSMTEGMKPGNITNEFASKYARRIWIPKFGFKGIYSLNSVLNEMGLDLSSLGFGENGLASSNGGTMLKQFNILQVDEERTTGASVTVGDIGWASFEENFKVDKPFGYIIGEGVSGIILMAGIVTDPTEL